MGHYCPEINPTGKHFGVDHEAIQFAFFFNVRVYFPGQYLKILFSQWALRSYNQYPWGAAQFMLKHWFTPDICVTDKRTRSAAPC
jgi:hypothetical protein